MEKNNQNIPAELRKPYELRPIQFELNPLKNSDTSVLVTLGGTKVLISLRLNNVKQDISTDLVQKEPTKHSETSELNLKINSNISNQQLLQQNIHIKCHLHPHSSQEIYQAIAEEECQSLKLGLVPIILQRFEIQLLQGFEVDIAVTFIEVDGGLFTATTTGVALISYYAQEYLLSPVDVKATTEQLPTEWLAGVQVGLNNQGVCVDMTSKQMLQAKATLQLIMSESGKFIYVQTGKYNQSITNNELNELLLYGKQTLEQLILIEKEVLIENQKESWEKLMEETDKTIVIATGNQGKAKEFKAIFSDYGYTVKTLADYPELPEVAETGHTFEENARLKAETIAKLLKKPVLADDSGLIVDALGGMPGIYSARYAGEAKSDAANNAKLLAALAEVPDEKRTARFHCTLVFAAPEKNSLVVEAQWPGHILRIPDGENGFGYDPLFFADDQGKSSAQLSATEKNRVSHRGQAVAKLKNQWQDWLEGEIK